MDVGLISAVVGLVVVLFGIVGWFWNWRIT